MEAGTQCILILDIGSNVRWYYDPRSRCALEPQHFHSQSEIMTNQTAFTDCKQLADTAVGEIVFVETHDRFSVWDGEQSTYVPSHRVWRKSQVLGPAVYPGRGVS